MKKLLTLTVLAGILAFTANNARADGPYPTDIGGPTGIVTPKDNTGEYEIYQAINGLLGTSYANNAALNSLEYTGDASTWVQTVANGSGNFIGVGIGAAAQNTLQVYTTPIGLTLSPFGQSYSGNGSLNNNVLHAYPQAPAPYSPNTQFDFVLNSVYGTTKNWDSNPALNADLMDHIVVYQLPSFTVNVYPANGGSDPLVTLNDPYFIGFEDLPIDNSITGSPSDIDYNDLQIVVDGVEPIGVFNSHGAPVPEPMTVALFGIGLLAMAGFAFRRNFGFAK
jgi:hypothetical protein